MRVLFVGAAGLDTVTLVESYPRADSKIRAIDQLIDGGGNAANSACAYSMLGADASLVTAIGDDHAAEVIITGLQSKGVNVSKVVRKANSNSGTTYVIVSKDCATRTCIHNAMAQELSPEDTMQLFTDDNVLQIYSAVHFDSRHTLASIALAERISRMGCLVSVDIEKIRPHALELLPFCDVIFCSQHFPAIVCPGESSHTQSMVAMYHQPWAVRCSMIVCTLGDRGSVLLLRDGAGLQDKIAAAGLNGCRDPATVQRWQQLEAKICTYCGITVEESPVDGDGDCSYRQIRCSARALRREEVVDTTGAGDAYIAAFLAALLHGWQLQNCMKLGALVASEKIRKQGARQGLPTLTQIEELLS